MSIDLSNDLPKSTKQTFANLNLDTALLRAIEESGYTTPTLSKRKLFLLLPQVMT